jgi:hypothetical protein
VEKKEGPEITVDDGRQEGRREGRKAGMGRHAGSKEGREERKGGRIVRALEARTTTNPRHFSAHLFEREIIYIYIYICIYVYMYICMNIIISYQIVSYIP